MDLTTYLKEEKGRAAKLARDLKVSGPTVHGWGFDPEKKLPIQRAPEIEFFSSAIVTCEEMLPDVTWVRVDDPDWPHPLGRPLIDVMNSRAAA